MNSIDGKKIREVYSVAFQLLGKRNQIEKLVEGIDKKNLDELKEQLHSIFHILNEDVDVSRSSHFKTVEHNIELALSSLTSIKNEDIDTESSFVFFRCAEQNAVQAFHTATNFEGKALATKIIVLTTLYLNDYFSKATSNCSEIIQSQCHQWFQMLLDTPEVKSAIEAESSRNVFISIRPTSTKAVRSEIYAELSNIRYCIYKYTSLACPVLNAQNQPVELTWMPKSVQAHRDAVTRVLLCDRSLVSTSLDGVVEVWEKSKFALLGSMNCEAPVNCVALLNGTLFVGTDSSLQLWDFQTHAKTQHLAQFEGRRVYSMRVLSEGGRSDLSVSFDDQVALVSLQDGAQFASSPHHPQGSFHHAACLGESGGRVFWHMVDAEGVSTLRVYNANLFISSEPVHTIAFDASPNCVCLSEDYLCAKSRGEGGGVRVWSVATLLVVTNLVVPPVHLSTTIFLSDMLHTSHQRLYAYCAASEIVRIFDLETLSEVGDLVLKKNYQLTAFHASREGDLFAGLSDGKVKEWAADIVMESVICAKALLLTEAEKKRLSIRTTKLPSSPPELVLSPPPMESESCKSSASASSVMDVSSVTSTYGGSCESRDVDISVDAGSPTGTPPVEQYPRHISFAQSPLDKPSACHRDMVDDATQCECPVCCETMSGEDCDREKYALYNNGGVLAMVIMSVALIAVL